jgi:hypothetical protein
MQRIWMASLIALVALGCSQESEMPGAPTVRSTINNETSIQGDSAMHEPVTLDVFTDFI